jgi:hypothetical protein
MYFPRGGDTGLKIEAVAVTLFQIQYRGERIGHECALDKRPWGDSYLFCASPIAIILGQVNRVRMHANTSLPRLEPQRASVIL